MIVRIEKRLFDSLAIDEVGHACFEPMIPVYQVDMRKRSGKEAYGYRAEFYMSLSEGQRALLGFFSYYDHAIGSKDEFWRISRDYLSQKIFGIVKKGAEYFCDDDMCLLLQRIEQAVLVNSQSDIVDDDKEGELYMRLREIAPRTLERIGACIKENPAEFICFV